MKNLPMARIENIVVQALETEVLIYDLITNKAFCLNETSTIVFNACDGLTSFDELKLKYQLTDDLIYFALDGLRRENLITQEYQSKFAGLSRREVIRKVGLTSMMALPVIASVIAPKSAHAQSLLSNGSLCTQSSECISEICSQFFGHPHVCCVSMPATCTNTIECCQRSAQQAIICSDGACCGSTGEDCRFASECCSGLTCHPGSMGGFGSCGV